MNAPSYQAIHTAYCHATGLGLPYVPWEHDSSWFLWEKRFDEDDLRSIIAYLKYLYRDKPDILRATLRFRNLVVQLDHASEYLAEARQWKARKTTPKEKILSTSGRPVVAKVVDAQSVGDVVKGLDCLKKLKEEMGW